MVGAIYEYHVLPRLKSDRYKHIDMQIFRNRPYQILRRIGYLWVDLKCHQVDFFINFNSHFRR